MSQGRCGRASPLSGAFERTLVQTQMAALLRGCVRLCLNKASSDEIIWHCKHAPQGI